MSTRDFYAGLGLTTLVTAVLIGAVAYIVPDLHQRMGYLLLCLAVFSAMCVGIFYSAQPAANATNKARLAQYVMVLTFVKMAISLALVYGYFLWARPVGQAFLIPFFMAYFGYTVFETIYLLRLNKATASSIADQNSTGNK